ncbi:MAG TPA: homogentisate 1,2-dioxygenase, partial [Thermoanaerobaculia bacterium]|nr:homogentisate 1,2-dioxygenase [Thermoanaerobaculia bacterium]
MLHYLRAGETPKKPHIAFRSADGKLRYEECFTRKGFDAEFSILYHEGPPMTDVEIAPSGPTCWSRQVAIPAPDVPLKRRLILGEKAPEGFTPILMSDDVVVSLFRIPAEAPSDLGFSNGDGADLFFLSSGKATLESPFGDVAVEAGDYVLVPRGVVHRFKVAEAMDGIVFELRGGFHFPDQFRNPVGQLRMDAPYTHRDFKLPVFTGPRPGPAEILVKKGDQFVKRKPLVSPFDVVGWDGTVWPFAFPILAYQPKTGLVHLPPTIHTTFASRGAVICSFVPRVTDTHPDAIPCPYPHTSVDCDELIYYVRGNFTSRKGVGPKAVSLHPAGIPHGPHPGSYEGSIGSRSTDELAVMVDTFRPL